MKSFMLKMLNTLSLMPMDCGGLVCEDCALWDESAEECILQIIKRVLEKE